MSFIEQTGGVFPRPIEIQKPPWRADGHVLDTRSSQMRDHVRPQNHSSRDRGAQLKVNPIGRSRRGNKR